MEEAASTLLDKLYRLNDWYFGADKAAQISALKSKVELLISANDYLSRGRLLNLDEGYNREAEKYLTKAVKLAPTHFSGWNALAMCLWKKGNKKVAFDCLSKSIQVRPNKEALQDISILSRQVNSNMEDSVKYAGEALALDSEDHKSWCVEHTVYPYELPNSSTVYFRYVLGNALTSKYFTNSNDIHDLQLALDAYSKAESLGGSVNPDMYYNRGMVLQYMLDYQGALLAYHAAFTIDPNLVETRMYFVNLNQYVHRLNQQLSEQLVRLHNPAVLSRTLASFASIGSLTTSLTTVRNLKPGDSNKSRTLALKVLVDVVYSTPPNNYICCDAEGRLVIVSFYNIGEGIRFFKADNLLMVKGPILFERAMWRDIGEWNSLRRDVPIVQVFDLRTVLVDGKTIPEEVIAPTVLKSIMIQQQQQEHDRL